LVVDGAAAAVAGSSWVEPTCVCGTPNLGLLLSFHAAVEAAAVVAAASGTIAAFAVAAAAAVSEKPAAS